MREPERIIRLKTVLVLRLTKHTQSGNTIKLQSRK
jgi:hypothetical protein